MAKAWHLGWLTKEEGTDRPPQPAVARLALASLSLASKRSPNGMQMHRLNELPRRVWSRVLRELSVVLPQRGKYLKSKIDLKCKRGASDMR